jgi:hypothetical protein
VQVLETVSYRNAGKTAYIRPKVVGPYASGSYVHRAALFSVFINWNQLEVLSCDHCG